MDLTTLIGLLAAFGTTFSFLPQAIKIIKTKNTEGISLSMYLMFSSGVFLWLLYGYLKSDTPVMLANGITLVLAVIILSLKIKYKPKS
ncbi:SemiSWEET family sugar transporter [Pedobacter segetis]|uniref:SemiSWEET family sugar transporter n=1 Tax=Pedobacter segetis TaxID=2793069 RepID=UPI00293D1EDF|nr:SemiSWEET transporter [Pedobacter segetis]